MAFTKTDLDNTLKHINSKLAASGKTDKTLRCEARGGYYGMDVYRGTRCSHTITISKHPKGLVGDAYEWAFAMLTD
jgi:hypothetical protein